MIDEEKMETKETQRDISKSKIEGFKGLAKGKVLGIFFLFLCFILLILSVHYCTASAFSKKKEVKKEEEVAKIVKENVTNEDEEEKYQEDLKKNYGFNRKKVTYEDKIENKEGRVENRVDYEQERLNEIKNKISAYKEKEFQEELASRSSSIEGGSASTRPSDTEKNSFDENLTQPLGVSVPPKNNNERMASYRDKLNADTSYNKGSLMNPLSEYELKSGGIIPITLYTGINTDIPSKVIAVVRENVFDSKSGRYLLIPKGTKAIGTYDSVLDFGQERVLLIWTRLVFPNGNSISLDKFDGVDLTGYGGSGGKVNSHFGTMLKAVVLSTLLSVGDYYVTPSSKDRNRYKTSSPEVIVKEQAVNTFSEIGKEYVDKMLGVQPTIIVKQGTRLNIIVNSDLILKPYSE